MSVLCIYKCLWALLVLLVGVCGYTAQLGWHISGHCWVKGWWRSGQWFHCSTATMEGKIGYLLRWWDVKHTVVFITHTIVCPQSLSGDDLINQRHSPTELSSCWCESDEMADDGLINMHQWFSHRPSLHSQHSVWLQLPIIRRNSDIRPNFLRQLYYKMVKIRLN